MSPVETGGWVGENKGGENRSTKVPSSIHCWPITAFFLILNAAFCVEGLLALNARGGNG